MWVKLEIYQLPNGDYSIERFVKELDICETIVYPTLRELQKDLVEWIYQGGAFDSE